MRVPESWSSAKATCRRCPSPPLPPTAHLARERRPHAVALLCHRLTKLDLRTRSNERVSTPALDEPHPATLRPPSLPPSHTYTPNTRYTRPPHPALQHRPHPRVFNPPIVQTARAGGCGVRRRRHPVCERCPPCPCPPPRHDRSPPPSYAGARPCGGRRGCRPPSSTCPTHLAMPSRFSAPITTKVTTPCTTTWKKRPIPPPLGLARRGEGDRTFADAATPRCCWCCWWCCWCELHCALRCCSTRWVKWRCARRLDALHCRGAAISPPVPSSCPRSPRHQQCLTPQHPVGGAAALQSPAYRAIGLAAPCRSARGPPSVTPALRGSQLGRHAAGRGGDDAGGGQARASRALRRAPRAVRQQDQRRRWQQVRAGGGVRGGASARPPDAKRASAACPRPLPRVGRFAGHGASGSPTHSASTCSASCWGGWWTCA